MFSSFFTVLAVIILCDQVFAEYLFEPYADLVEYLFGTHLGSPQNLDLSSSAESWLALLATVLGTLIIVISIASQSIPKLIDLYMQDRTSLYYIWLLILSGVHAILVKMYAEIGLEHSASRVFNMHFLLPLCGVSAFPYIFYILKYTKPNNVINRISRSQLHHIQALASQRIQVLMDIPKMVEEYQGVLFEALNQLDDLLEYVSFKEPKANIIQDMTLTIQEHIRLKAKMNAAFFKVSDQARSDISFKTMVGQFEAMEKNQTFYEQKCFRLLGNVYIKLLEKGEFDLASLCASEMTSVGLTAIEMGDDALVDVIIIRFNTYLRFAIKHGVKNNEARNLYTTAFHYGNFISHLVRFKKIAFVKKCFMYMRIYGTEIFKHGRIAPSMYFIVDVFAAEMKKSLMLIYENQWDMEIQEGLLKEMLMVDSPPDFNKEDMDKGLLIASGVRVLQIGLGLFYLREGVSKFVQMIIHDVLDDLETLGEKTFRQVVEMTSNRLKFSGPTFWEDTDRGNLNIYYTSDQNQLEAFKALVYEKVQERLLLNAQKQFALTPEESLLLWELSRFSPTQEVLVAAREPLQFENALVHLENLDQERLAALVSLRNKLQFTSENHNLTITNTRQIAVNMVLDVIYSDYEQKKKHAVKARVVFNYPNYLYIKFTQPFDISQLQQLKIITFQFKSLRQKLTYQFQSNLEGDPVEDLYKVVHRKDIKIVSAG